MRTRGEHPYFARSRENHERTTFEIAKKVAEHRRSWPYLRRDGFVEVYGYSPELHQWILVVVTGDGLLFNGYTDDDRDKIRMGMNRVTRGF